MRTRSPLWVVVTYCTGVPKSATSSLRRSVSGRLERKNSTTRLWPCWRMSTPTWVLASATMTRPAPSAPRRKSTSRKGRFSALPAAGAAAPALSSTTTSTRRVRSPAWAIATDRRLPWLMSTKLRPKALATRGRSIATRGGVCTKNTFGGKPRGSASSIRTTSVPAWGLLVIARIAFSASASTGATPASTKAANRLRHLNMLDS